MSTVRIRVRLPSEDLPAILEQYDRLKIYRSTTGREGTYAELSTAATRIRLVAGETDYAFTDPDGLSAYYYTTAFFNSRTNAESAQSEPMLGNADAALDLLSAQELKELYLHGVELRDRSGRTLPTATLEWHIKVAVSKLERILDITLRRLVITDERIDFDRIQYQDWIFLQLVKFPLISVEEVRMVLPNNQRVLTYNQDWVYESKEAAHLQIIPGSGQLITGGGNIGLATLMGIVDTLPHVFRVDYTAGFERGSVPEDILDVVAKFACLQIFGIANRLAFRPGISEQRMRLDDLMTVTKGSNIASMGAYGDIIKLYLDELKQTIPDMRRTYKGLRVWTM